MEIGKFEYNHNILPRFLKSKYPERKLRSLAKEYFEDNPDFFD